MSKLYSVFNNTIQSRNIAKLPILIIVSGVSCHVISSDSLRLRLGTLTHIALDLVAIWFRNKFDTLLAQVVVEAAS